MQYGSAADVLLGKKKIARDGRKLSVRVNRNSLRSNPLYVFERQKEAGRKLDRAVKGRLAAVLNTDLSGSGEVEKMRRIFPGLLRDGKNSALILRAMHETGFLGRIIPEYDFLSCLKRYDLYHHFTVDEHSFKVVHNLERLSRAGRAKVDFLARLYSEIPDKQVLFLAALLHDVGKIKGGGHARKGAVIARKILERMSLKDEQITSICFLIENHLIMSHFSQRRDPTDIGMLRVFCTKVKNRTNLKAPLSADICRSHGDIPVGVDQMEAKPAVGAVSKGASIHGHQGKTAGCVLQSKKADHFECVCGGCGEGGGAAAPRHASRPLSADDEPVAGQNAYRAGRSIEWDEGCGCRPQEKAFDGDYILYAGQAVQAVATLRRAGDERSQHFTCPCVYTQGWQCDRCVSCRGSSRRGIY
ncbi:MAG: HD domain-containing protein [Candidatus Latescibacterota bacterium]